MTCATCHDASVAPAPAPPVPTELDRGQAGASAGREHQRREVTRKTEIREAHPWIGGVLATVDRAPQRETAFRRGEQGEIAVGEMLEKRAAKAD